MNNALQDLRTHLNGLTPGPIKHSPRLIALVQAAWDTLPGSSAESTTSDKLGRMEEVSWDPPTLSFTLERHGGTVNGSTRADLHYWSIDTQSGTAEITGRSYRQLAKRAAPMNVKPLAEEVLDILQRGLDHDWVDWLDDDRTRAFLHIKKVVPDAGFKKTVEGRRRRFNRYMKKRLPQVGWDRNGHGAKYHTYERA